MGKYRKKNELFRKEGKYAHSKVADLVETKHFYDLLKKKSFSDFINN